MPASALLAVRTAALLDFLLQEMVDDLQASLGAQGLDLRFGLENHFQHWQVELEVHRVEVEFGAGLGQRTGVLFLHAVVGFGLFIYFTAELVGSAAKPPTAFSTIQGTFPKICLAPFYGFNLASGLLVFQSVC
jgi:hypothetical protein